MLGGYSEARELSEEEVSMIMSMKDQLEAQINRSLNVFKPIEIKSQVVAGMNYRVKIEIDNNEFIHVKIFRPLPHTNEQPSIVSAEVGKAEEDEF